MRAAPFRYRSLAERVLGVRAVYQEPSMQRSVSFEFMNRQLVWNQLSVRGPNALFMP